MAATMSEVFRISSEYIDAMAALDPFGATGMGVPGHDHEVTDFSPEGQAARAALNRATLSKLDAARGASHDDDVARDVMRDSLLQEIERYEAGDQYYELRSIAGPVQALQEVFELMPRDTEADWRNIVLRLEGLPRSAASLQQMFQEGIRRGQLSARRQVEETLRQVTSFSGGNPEVAAAFAGLPALLEEAGIDSPGLTSDLERAIGREREAFTGLHAFIEERYLNEAPEAEAAGRERYARAANQFLGSRIDLNETYAWGWEEVGRLGEEMRRTADRIRPGAAIAEAAGLLDADAARTIEGEAALIAWLQAVEDTAISNLDGVHFNIAGPVKTIEACIAPPGGALAQYYTPPSEDFSRPGRTWYPTGGHTQFHRWRELTTAYHEGVPGHHLQCATAVYQAEHLSRFHRLAVWYPGYGEGWALYAERLMAELGYLNDAGDYLGMLLGQMHRAVRVVVDLGMHLQLPIPNTSTFEPGEQWSYERMLAFLMERAQMPHDMAHSEVVRYLGWPAQAISYKVGERAWLRLREESRARHPQDFSLKTFHDTALALGSMGLDRLGDLLRVAY